MPGKYSHSVVLADYSSRGIINLPNDQHVAYLRSSPYPKSHYSRASSRAGSEKALAQHPRSRSAVDFTNHHGSDTGTFSSPGRRVIIDAGIGQGTNDNVLTNFRWPSSSNDTRIPSTRGAQPTTRSEKSSHVRTTTPSTVTANISLPKPTSSEVQHPALRAKSSQGVKIRAEAFLREAPRASSQARNNVSVEAESKAVPVSVQEAPAKLAPAIVIKPKREIDETVAKQAPSSRPAAANIKHPSRPLLTRPGSQETQIYSPQKPIAEPDFEGFSDAGEPEASYFEKRAGSNSTSALKGVSQAAHHSNRLETPSPGHAAPVSESRARTYRSLSTEPSESDTFAGIGTSPTYSHGKLDSLTSLSTNSSKGVTPTSRTAKHGDTKKTVVDHAAQEWRLPEIHEDIAFNPDFFTQGPEDFVRPTTSRESVDSFLDRPLGTVSAGRDVDFSMDHENDADSEVDAACPPDIGRFRSDDELGNSSYTQGMRNDSTIGKGTGSSFPASKTKKTGFFARLRSVSKQRS